METNKTAAILEDLVETLEDGNKGFEQAAEKLAKDADASAAGEFKRFAQQRQRFGAELRQLAAKDGHKIDENGSAGGAMHRGWIALADALTGDDPHAVLAAAEAGEDHAVQEYKDALESDVLSAEQRSVIQRQYDEITQAHDAVRNMRDAAA